MSVPSKKKGGFRWTFWRRTSQFLLLLFFALLPVTYRSGQVDVIGTLASLQIGPIHLVDPATGISTALAARSVHTALLTGMILPLLLAFALGPVFCSWVCPWGLLSEMIDKLLRRRARPVPDWVAKLRWTFLGGLFAISLGIGSPIVATISAPRLLTELPMDLIFLGGASAGTVVLLGVLLVLEFVLPRRLWCRALCPVGSTLVLLRTPWTATIRWKNATCITGGFGGHCVKNCPWNLDPRRMGKLSGCTNCARCIEVCPPEPVTPLSFSSGDLGDRASEKDALESFRRIGRNRSAENGNRESATNRPRRQTGTDSL